MRKTITVLLCAVFLIFGTTVFAQNSEENEGTPEKEDEEATVDEIAAILEEINQKMGEMKGPAGEDEGAPDFGFGGGPYWPVRILFDIDKLNGYMAGVGTYEAFPMVIIPMVDGGGGTWRWAFNKNFQIGMNYFGAGFSSRGQQHHPAADSTLATTYPQYGVITVDENGDSLDDYYTYASYDFFYWSFLMQGKAALHKRINILGGAQVGFGSEFFTVSRNDRTSGPLAGALGVMNGDSNWERDFLVTGGWLGVQLNVDDKNVFKLGLDVGFDYNIPFTPGWEPSAGTHIAEAAPPADFNVMNLWITLGPQFHF